MAENGVPIYAVSVQNEPDVRVDYESCDWNAGEMLSFVKENAPAIGTNIIAPESFHFDHALSDPILNDDIAVANVSIIGGHLYGGGLESYPLAGSKGKQIWMTEYLDTDTTWNRVLATGKQMNDCMTAGMSAYIWWYIVRFYGPIGEDGNVTKRGYIMSQYSRFIRPGYERINATERPQRRLYVTAYKSDSNVIIVVVNQSSSPAEQTFGIQGIYAREPVFTPYVTSRTKNCLQESDLQVNKGSFTVIFEGESVTTLVGENVIDSTQTPQTITLYQNFPNPFYQSTKISYTVPSSGIVSLKVFNVLGQEIKTLVHAYHDTGEYKVLFNAMNLSCGIYFYTLKVGDNSAVTKKMLLIH